MKKVIGVITARMTSTRLPGKVLKPIGGKSIFAHHVERMKDIIGLDGVFLATSRDQRNRVLIEEAQKLGCGWYAGSEEDILERHIHLCENENADAVIRVTCDCPLFNIDITSEFVDAYKKHNFDFIYCSNMTMIQGTLTELISCKVMKKVHEFYRGPAISLPIREHFDLYDTVGMPVDEELVRPEYRLTVDEPADLSLMEQIYNALYKGKALSLYDVYRWLDDNPQITKINQHVGIKGVNKYSANLMEAPIYSIVKSGGKYTILDEQKRFVSPRDFLSNLIELFPDLQKTNVERRR
jgi:spore coat polysaccharide biosynthesis protein SpsF